MADQPDNVKVNRQLTLKSLFVYTSMIAIAIVLVVADDPNAGLNYAQILGWFSLVAMTGGAIGFLVYGRAGFLYGLFALPILLILFLQVFDL